MTNIILTVATAFFAAVCLGFLMLALLIGFHMLGGLTLILTFASGFVAIACFHARREVCRT